MAAAAAADDKNVHELDGEKEGSDVDGQQDSELIGVVAE